MSTPAREIAEKKAWEIVQRDFRREMHCGVMEVTAADLSGLEEAITAALTRSEEEKNALQDDLERIKVASGQDKPWCNADTVIEGIRHMRLVIESNRVDVAKYEAAQDSLSTLTARLKEAEEEHGKELRRWQDAIRDKVIDLAGCPDFKIDGAGCDSGEPLEFTLTEISQGFGWVADEIVDPLKQRLKEAEGQIENLLASAVPNAIDHPTMFAAWESARSFLTASTPVEKEACADKNSEPNPWSSGEFTQVPPGY